MRYTKQKVAIIIGIEGFWKAVECISPDDIIDPVLKVEWESIQEIKYHIETEILAKYYKDLGLEN